MRHGFVGAVLALSASAGLAWGQFPPAPRDEATIIPPPLPGGVQGFGNGITDPNQAPTYPPPGNWDMADLNGPAGGDNSQPAVARWWINTEYVMWFPKSAAYSTQLVTSSAPSSASLGGNASSQLFYGLNSVNFGLTSGMRLNTGLWLDSSGRYGINASYWHMDSTAAAYYNQSNADGTPVLARPFTTDPTNFQGTFIVAAPNYAAGSVYNSTTIFATGADMNFMLNLFRTSPDSKWGYGLTALAGFRYFEFSENVAIGSYSNLLNNASIVFNNQTYTAQFGTNTVINQTVNPTGVGAGQLNQVNIATTTISNNYVNLSVLDQIKASNNFYGGNAGLYQYINCGRWSIGAGTSLGFGDMHQQVSITGNSVLNAQQAQTTTIAATQTLSGNVLTSNSTTTSGTQTSVAPAGLYNQANSIGVYTRDRFAYVPELNLRLGYAFTSSITGYIGYNVVYANNVVRASDVVTGVVNPNLQPTNVNYGNPTTARQINPFPTSDFWMQGISFGLNFRY